MAALSRVVPHPPNFAPITAMAVFSGWYFLTYGSALLVVIASMVASDVALAMLHGDWSYLFHTTLPAIYVSFALIIALSRWIARQRRDGKAAVVALVGGSTVFFVLSNFAVWAFGTLYPHTLEGLATCYLMAVPFYHINGLAPFELVRNMVVGDLFYGTLLFGLGTLVERVSMTYPSPVTKEVHQLRSQEG